MRSRGKVEEVLSRCVTVYYPALCTKLHSETTTRSDEHVTSQELHLHYLQTALLVVVCFAYLPAVDRAVNRTSRNFTLPGEGPHWGLLLVKSAMNLDTMLICCDISGSPVDSSSCRTCRFAETGDSTGTREQSRSLVTLAEAASPS